jgi:hypothetical protein
MGDGIGLDQMRAERDKHFTDHRLAARHAACQPDLEQESSVLRVLWWLNS